MEDQELSHAVKTRASYHRAPAALRAQLDASLNQTVPARTSSPVGYGFGRWSWLSAGGAFAFGLVFALGIVLTMRPGLVPGPSAHALTEQIVASHVRSLMASHLMDVASTDQHTVKPWFNGKVDFSPPVNDLVSQGFPLVGGRLDYLERRPVAALVYKRNAHPINLFIWPENGADETYAAAAEQGYHVMQWRQSGMRYGAVSDVNSEELRAFTEAYRRLAGG